MPRRLSVRFVTRKWAPAIGGMETYCLQLTSHLKDKVDLHIEALPGRADGRAPNGLQILRFGIIMMFKLLTGSRVDVVHVSDMASWPLALFAKLRHRKVKLILSAHGSDLSYGQRKGILAKIYNLYIRCGAAVLGQAIILANSTWIAELAREIGFKTVRHIPLATDMTATSALPGSPSRSLFYAGRVIKSKGVSFIINNVLPLLPDDITLRVAGTIWEEEEGASLTHPRVEFLGQLEAKDLAREYAEALCVVVPSIAPEGFGLVAIEAAIAGGVVVASDHSGLAEVCAGDLGQLARCEDAKHWADMIKTIEEWTLQKRRSFISKAQEQAQQRYSWERVARETLEAYESSFSNG